MYTSCFVDFTKAFDSVWRKGLLGKMKHIGITGKIYNIIEHIYSNTTYSLIHNKKITKPYNSQVGIKQGDNLSTPLFNIYLNDLPNYLNEQSADPMHINDGVMNTMMFADDLFPHRLVDYKIASTFFANTVQNENYILM